MFAVKHAGGLGTFAPASRALRPTVERQFFSVVERDPLDFEVR
jgi:hypothetical protein